MDWSWAGPPLDVHALFPAGRAELLAHLGPQLDDLWAALDLTTLGEAVSRAAPGVPAPV
jgi:hypothetical protein